MGKLVSSVIDSFKKHRSAEPDVVSAAPGRVNLIGEHTDYTGGYVLPAAIDRTIVFAAKKEIGSDIKGWSTDFAEEATCFVGDYDRSHPSEWFRYVLGVLSELENAGRSIGGFSFTVGGDIPIGAGLSSSAAFETAVLTAMEDLYEFHMNDTEAALLCQRAENNFVGMNCGIMDQLISRTGRKDHAVFMNCTDLSTKPVILHTPGFSWVVVDSKKRRGLVDSEYNKRRRECEEALAVARSTFPDRNIGNLRDVTLNEHRQEKFTDENESDCGKPFITGDSKTHLETRTGHPDEMLRRYVGGDKRSPDYPPCQISASQEIICCVFLFP